MDRNMGSIDKMSIIETGNIKLNLSKRAFLSENQLNKFK